MIPFGCWRWGYGGWYIRAVSLALMAVAFFFAVRQYGTEREIKFSEIVVCLFGGIAVPLFLSSLIPLKMMENGRFLVLLPVLCAFTTGHRSLFCGRISWETPGCHQGQPLINLWKAILEDC